MYCITPIYFSFRFFLKYIVLFLLIIFVLVFKKKTNIQKIKLKREKIKELLTTEEDHLLSLIEDYYPNYITLHYIS